MIILGGVIWAVGFIIGVVITCLVCRDNGKVSDWREVALGSAVSLVWPIALGFLLGGWLRARAGWDDPQNPND